MQTLRNIAWWFIGLTTLITFGLVVFLSSRLGDVFDRLPQSAIITVYVALAFGLINTTKVLQSGDTLVHEIGHAQFAALTFGSVHSIHTQRDSSGVTYFRPPRLFRRLVDAIVSLFGPLGSLVVFVITARLLSSELAAYWVLGVSTFILLILITTVRNVWGWLVGLFILGIMYVLLESIGFVDPLILSSDQKSLVNSLLVQIILGLTAFNAGVAIRYSYKVRVPRNPHSDEARFGSAIFLGPRIGGLIILLIEIYLLLLALSYMLGWTSVFEIGVWL